MSNKSSRRKLIKQIATGSLAVAVAPLNVLASSYNDDEENEMLSLKGNINHSVASWTYNFMPLEEQCRMVKKIGFTNIDLLTPKEWPIAKANGINCSMCYTGGKTSLTEGWNKTENHSWLLKDYLEAIPLVSTAGYKNLICFSGNKNGMDDETGLKNMTAGIKQIIGLAEKNNVVVQIEVFNSKVNHPDYMADNTKWAIELCKRIGSPNFKILYDIYHMQISEGDIIATIKKNHEYFGHYHTAGVPGRNDIDETQELFYPAIMKAIIETGYKGYVAQEFMASAKDNKDKVKALKKAIKICDV
jgi:hydroxypyruvate isomerase